MYRATVMEVLMMENNKDRGNAEPYILSRRCRPHEVLLYVIILPGAATALAARSATLASSYGVQLPQRPCRRLRNRSSRP